MPDPTEGTPAEGAIAGQATAQTPPVDFAAFEAKVMGEMDKRVAGFQRVIAGKDTEIQRLAAALDEAKTAGLSETEREQLRQQRLEQENRALHAQVDLMSIAPEYPTELPYFTRLIQAQSAQEQLAVIREIRAEAVKAATPAAAIAPAAPADEGAALSDGSDPNNPARPMSSFYTPDKLNEAQADSILSRFTGPLGALTQRGRR